MYQDVGAVGTQSVAAVAELGNDLAVPLSLCLGGGDEAGHDDIVDLAPILRCARCDVCDDVGIGVPVEAWLVADWAFADFDDAFFAGLIVKVVFA